MEVKEIKHKTNKKGQLTGAAELAVGLILLTLIVAVGAIVLSDVQSTEGNSQCGGNTNGFTNYNQSANQCQNGSGSFQAVPNGEAVNVTGNGITGLSNMSTQFGTIGTVAIAAVLLALVVAAFVFRR